MKPALLLLLTHVLAPVQGAKEMHSLLPQVQVGDRFVFSYRGETSAAGIAGVFRARFEMAVASLEPKGTITFKTDQREAAFESAGQTRAVPDSTVSSRFRLNGIMLSADPGFDTPERARMSRLMWIVVPEEKAGVGAQWKWSSEPNEANGQIGLKGAGECLAFETRQEIRCAKLRLTAKEESGEQPGSAKMEVWVSLKDGMPVEVIAELSNVPLGPGAAGSMKFTNRRVSRS